MKVQVIHETANCDQSTCPTIYQDEQGNYIIQGFTLNKQDKSELPIPEGEDVIRIPADFLLDFVQTQK